MEEQKKSKNAKKKPFKQTRQLIKMALNDGWTQTEIAKQCRVHQSIVSGWKNGSKCAPEAQLKPLLEIYGHKLRRNSFRIYWSIDHETGEKTFYRVEGQVIFTQAFTDPRRDGTKLVKKIPQLKLVIHYQGNAKFRIVRQNRLIFRASNNELECSQEDGIWNSFVCDALDSNGLIRFVDQYAEDHLKTYPSDANTLPFLIRKALLNHGFQVDGIVEYPASW